jgi:error-prone DNA polymerase
MPYVELHAASAFSFLRAASAPETLAREAAELGLPAIALCDRSGLYGSPRLHQAASSVGVRGIVGAELVLEDGSTLPVLVQSRTGYRNLCRLLTDAHLRRGTALPEGMNTETAPNEECLPDAIIRWKDLEGCTEGLVALGGDIEGPLHTAWRRGSTTDLAATMERLRRLFGKDAFFPEIQRHERRGEDRWNRVLTDCANTCRLPLVATGGVLMARPEEREVLDLFTCLRHHTHLDAAGRLLSVNDGRRLRNEAEMRALFADMPQAVENSGILAERLTFTLEDLGYAFPSYPVPQGETMDSFLAKLVWFGAQQRYGGLSPKVRRQIRHELDLISRLGFSGYFLVVWDIVTYAREQGILVQGRGSAANSAVCYSLGITAVDPVGQDLLFERFLSEGRKSWPDIDLDLPSGPLRERVIQEVYRRHGPRGAGMTANVITYRSRGAAREILKALNLPAGIADRFSRLFAGGDYPHTLQLHDQMRQAGLDPDHPRAAAFLRLHAAVRGLPRHLGQHSGGMIICQGALDSVVPLQPASMPGRVVVQWDKDDCEDLGIVKVDFLGLGMLAAIQDCLELTRNRGRGVDLATLPKDDPATYDLLCKADTIGTFQVESRAQQATLPRMKPRTFYDLVVEIAIIRPGPIQGRMVHPYLERRSGRAPITYADPALEPILGRTLGIALFQEQVLKIAMVLGGFTASEAEELRRALSFTRSPERMERAVSRLHEKLRAAGYGEALIEDLSRQIRSFALYGFPESHAISFAMIAYASCWLKVHRTVEFYVALLNNQPMGFYSPATLVQDARRHGIRVRPPCLFESSWECSVENDRTLRIGLCMLRGLRREHVERWKARASTSRDPGTLSVFNRTERRVLAASGALAGIFPHRRAALWAVEDAGLDEDPGLLTLPVGSGESAAPPLGPMSLAERIASDFSTTGMTAGDHPMALVRDAIPDHWRACDLQLGRTGERLRVSGAVICRQRPGTGKGVVFVSLEDETGISNIICRSGFFERHRLLISHEPFLTFIGILQAHEGVMHILAESVERLEIAANALPENASHDFH